MISSSSAVRLLAAGGLMAVAVSIAGCVTVTPKGFGAEAPRVMAPDAAPVAVSARLVEAPTSRFNANGIAFDVDRNVFSQELAALLSESLSRAGVDVTGERQIEVQVDYIDFLFKGPCLLDYRVILGGGETFGLQSRGESGNFSIACRRAVEAAVADIVHDERTAAFLRGE